MKKYFNYAKPVWLYGKEKEINLTAGFRCQIVKKEGFEYRMHITGSTLYRVYINGSFVHYGPVRAPHGYLRVDKLDITQYLNKGGNIVAIEVAGYNCNSYYTLNVLSFLQVEILEGDKVVVHTANNGSFSAIELRYREQKVMRYSFQRNFSEVYRMDNHSSLFEWTVAEGLQYDKIAEIDLNKKYLQREVPIPNFYVRSKFKLIEYGNAQKIEHPGDFKYIRRRFINKISDTITGFVLNEIEDRPFETMQDYRFDKAADILEEKWSKKGAEVSRGEYLLFDMGVNNSGFILLEMTALEDSDVYFLFDEKLIDGKVDIKSWDSINIIKYSLKKSQMPYNVESFECYGFKYIMCFVEKGRVKLQNLSLREYSYPKYKNIDIRCDDEKINEIFMAALETYRQNTLDVFMDCPTRERAGWLCDSYFTAQSAWYFSGDTVVEKVFLENFLLADEFPGIPKGMLPMCYPAEHADGNFIPQWAMWYVIQLEGYFERSPEEDRYRFKKICYDLIGYFKKFKNSDGLLEKLEKWNFIEWSKANEWVFDVNYPTNMLYSKMLKLIGIWYEDIELLKESERVRKKVIEQSFDGKFFVDNAVRQEDGSLMVTENRSEVCQYYAFFFDVAKTDDPAFKYLKNMVLNVFGPSRRKRNEMPEIAYANSFIGYYLRLEILLRWEEYQQVLAEVKDYFYHMARTTGTLWENDSAQGSLNHGFASFAGVAIIKSLKGLGGEHLNV